jgi:hypothetical protein
MQGMEDAINRNTGWYSVQAVSEPWLPDPGCSSFIPFSSSLLFNLLEKYPYVTTDKCYFNFVIVIRFILD